MERKRKGKNYFEYAWKMRGPLPLDLRRRLIYRRKMELIKRDPAAMRMEGLLKEDDVPAEVNEMVSQGKLGEKWNTTIWRMIGETSTEPFASIRLGGVRGAIKDGRKNFEARKN